MDSAEYQRFRLRELESRKSEDCNCGFGLLMAVALGWALTYLSAPSGTDFDIARIWGGAPAQGMSAGTAKTAKPVEGEARQPGPARDAPNA